MSTITNHRTTQRTTTRCTLPPGWMFLAVVGAPWVVAGLAFAVARQVGAM